MKGFGNNNRTKKKSKEKKDNNSQKDKLISNALSLHSKGKIKEALEIYKRCKIYMWECDDNICVLKKEISK